MVRAGEARHVAGIDVGGTKVLAVLAEAGRPSVVLAERRIATPGGTELLDVVAELVVAMVVDLGGGSGSSVGAVGIGLPGLVDRRGIFHSGPHVSGLVGVDVATELGRRVGVPVAVDNDAACAATAEFDSGAGRGHGDGLMITVGTGIGGGIVSDGALRRGSHGFAAEVGHQVIDSDGPMCPCGRRGCWEQLASGTALGRQAREAGVAGDGEALVAAVRSGDDAAGRVLDRFAGLLATGLVNLFEVLDPSITVLGGGLAGALDVLGPRLDATLAEVASTRAPRPPVPVVAAAHGERAGAIGAATMAARHH